MPTKPKPAFEVTFEQEGLGQLIQLQNYFKLEDKGEVVRLGISLLRRIMESQKDPVKFMQKLICLTAIKK